MNKPLKIETSGLTDKGCVRPHNEDALLVRPELPLLVVADGVGGAAAGEIASELFTTRCAEEFERRNDFENNVDEVVKSCFIHANQAIRDHAREFPDTKGMGCTAEVLTFLNQEYIIGHVGDSRSYLFRDKTLSRLTKDHSYVQEQIDLGLLHEDEAGSHWMRNAIYRAVGQSDELEVDIIRGKTRPGDYFLLCSDGLTDMVSEERIGNIIALKESVDKCNKRLLAEAKTNGGKDNITIVLCQLADSGGFLSSVKSLLGK